VLQVRPVTTPTVVFSHGIRIDATPRGQDMFNTLGLNASRLCHLNGSRVCTHDLVRFVTDRLLNRGLDTRNAAPLRMGVRPRFAAFHFSRFTVLIDARHAFRGNRFEK
jgi:hypothetical protein